MRHGRSKQARRTLQFLERVTANFRAPYNILLDGTFVVAVVKYKLPLHDRLDKVLQHNMYTLAILPSSLAELDKILESSTKKNQPENIELIKSAIAWANHQCQVIEEDSTEIKDGKSHDKDLSDASRGMIQFLMTSNRCTTSTENDTNSSSGDSCYFCASQDEEVLDRVRNNKVIVPVIRLARGSVLLLEQPSKSSQRLAFAQERTKWTTTGAMAGGASETKLVKLARQRDREDKKQSSHPLFKSNDQHSQRRKQKKAKGPNPLSCKKKRGNEAVGDRKKRRTS